MSKVIDIEDRLKLEQRKKAKVDKAKKLEAVRKTIQCTRCLARCAKCNIQFDTQEMYQRFKGPYRFCASCQEEYEEFVRLRGTEEQSPYYWHNKHWLLVWQAWLDYQQAMKDYGESPEFIELMREVEWDR
jgi:Pyruvate/2-oxoacid:ferredoxin oxidoreductase delta subunit